MGDNSGYAYMQATIIALYNADSLTPLGLKSILRIYRGTDIDRGGYDDNLKAKGGLTLEQVAWKVLNPGQPEPAQDEEDWQWPCEEWWYKLTKRYGW